MTLMRNKSSQNVNIKYLKHLLWLRVEVQELKNDALVESGVTIMCYKESHKQDTRENSAHSRETDRPAPNGPLIYLH